MHSSTPVLTTADRIVAVGVPIPGLGLLSYRVPPGMPLPPKGARVHVPIGGRIVTGCVVDPHATAPPPATLRDVARVLDEQPFLPSLVVDLALWAGDYYAAGPGDALAVAMPPASRRGEASAFRTVQVATLRATAGPPAVRGAKQRELIGQLSGRVNGLTLTELGQLGIAAGTVRSLAKTGAVTMSDRIVERDPFADLRGGGALWTLRTAPAGSRSLTEEQTEALGRLEEAAARRSFSTVLLQGVTGSGKTELYLRLAGSVLQMGRRVLVLVPEIGLTPAVAGLFRASFGSRVAIQHSGLSNGERHDQWHRIRRGEIDIVVGTRSAVFAPLPTIGLVIVDEEHDTAYKQEESPRYNGRDVAIVRARMEEALVVLGTATPSLESAANAASGRYGHVVLTRRILDRPLASVQVVDMRKEYAAHGSEVILSGALLAAIEDRLAKQEQSLVLLNRRGFATVIFCRQCGASMECPHCSVTLTFHRLARRVRCHYCNYSAAVPKQCGECGGEFLEQSGFGTERIESELRERFGNARVARVDRDTMRRRGALARVLTDVAGGVIDIVVGTQMIAKGHDFPAVTLVGVIAADVGLGRADFRASERTFQLLTQVVGRAGRGETPGHAVVQTLYPEHYCVRAAAAQDYGAFFAKEMEFRSAMHYPPSVALINVVIKGRSLEAALADATDLVKRVRRQGPQGKVLGPAPAPLAKVKDEYRAQFFIKGSRRTAMREALQRALAERPDLKQRVSVDVDPVNVA